jgi:predicted transcriptional regulator
MGKYRDRLQIIADILSVVRNGAKKTHVMYQANLSYALLSRYLTEVLDGGLISVDGEGRYRITISGQTFLDRFDEYSKRCGQIEKQLGFVNDEKTALEDMINDNHRRRSKEPAQAKRNKKGT